MPSPQPGTSKDTKDLSPRPAPRAIASLQLTEQARVLLQQDRSDDAISLLERAISLNPSDGRNYYYMAEAWLHKRNMAQAREFNRLAEIYLEENDDWIVKTSRQKERIRGALP
jgi:predicted Zn-dependent protease